MRDDPRDTHAVCCFVVAPIGERDYIKNHSSSIVHSCCRSFDRHLNMCSVVTDCLAEHALQAYLVRIKYSLHLECNSPFLLSVL